MILSSVSFEESVSQKTIISAQLLPKQLDSSPIMCSVHDFFLPTSDLKNSFVPPLLALSDLLCEHQHYLNTEVPLFLLFLYTYTSSCLAVSTGRSA
jgi:hypothetical protein